MHGAKSKIIEELGELFEEIDRGDRQRAEEEAGDLLFAIVNVLRLLDIDPETALTGCSERFIGRFTSMELIASAQEEKLSELDLDALEALWAEAKRRERQEGSK